MNTESAVIRDRLGEMVAVLSGRPPGLAHLALGQAIDGNSDDALSHVASALVTLRRAHG